MLLTQIIATFFIGFALSRAYLRFRDGVIGLWSVAFWSVLWIGAGVFIYWPGLFEQFASVLGIGRIVDVFVYGGIMLLFYLMFRAYIKVQDLEGQITKLTRQLALQNLKKESAE